MENIFAIISDIDITPGEFQYSISNAVGIALCAVIIAVDRFWTVTERRKKLKQG